VANEGASETGPTTPLAALHEDRGAKFTSFAGWQMPLQFTSILDEHEAVRERVGVFDVSHMGNLEVPDTQAEELASALGADVTELAAERARYTLVLGDEGTILDDVIVFHRGDRFHVVPNAGRNEVVGNRLEDQGGGVADLTRDRCILALQGPEVHETLEEATGLEHPGRFRLTELPEQEGFVSGTGYTGEEGVEFVVDPEHAKALWSDLVDAGADPAGLGARDTLRLEKGFPLAGNEFDPPVTPVEAQMLWAIDLEHDFVGRSEVVTRREAGPERVLTGVKLQEKGIPRRDCPVLHEGDRVGRISSGTMSPSLDVGIGLAYLEPEVAEEGTEIAVEVRERELSALIEEAPFL
jgi:aminomethyltransferase